MEQQKRPSLTSLPKAAGRSPAQDKPTGAVRTITGPGRQH
jgi:hypothetical protein